MKFVWKDDVISSATENKYIVKDGNNEVVYEGIVPVVGSDSLFYLNRVAQKLMHNGTVDFTTGVKSHPEMSIELMLYDENYNILKYELYVNAYDGEPVNKLSNPINGKLDPRMKFLWSAYNDYETTIAINEPQPPPPEYHLWDSGKTNYNYEQQSSLIYVDCSDWDNITLAKWDNRTMTPDPDWFNIQKVRNGIILDLYENNEDFTRWGEIKYYHKGADAGYFLFRQSRTVDPVEFVLELSGTTSFDYNYNISKLYVVECTDWSSVQVYTEESWIELTKQDNGVVVEVAVNFGDNSRVGEIIFTHNSQIVKRVSITQSMYNFTLVVSGDTEFNYEQQASNLYVVECSNWNDVYIQQNGNWFTATKNSTGVTLSINENTGASQRTGEVIFYYDGQVVNQQYLRQNVNVPYLTVSGDTDITYSQQDLNIYVVDSNVSWSNVSIIANSNWFTYTKTSTGVTLNVNENTTDSARTGQVNFIYNGATLTTFNFTQENNSPQPVINGYLTTSILSGGTLELKNTSSSGGRRVAYRKNNGEWVSGNTYPGISVSVEAGDSVEWKGLSALTRIGGSRFYSNGSVMNVSGNIMSIVYGDDYSGKTDLSTDQIIIGALFSGTNVYDASALSLPATVLNGSCYNQMFQGCTMLIAAPALPATTLAESCYSNMFERCYNLTTAPILPASTVPNYAYYSMFGYCELLNYVKCLAETFGGTGATWGWLNVVSSTGTFVKKSGVSWERGISGIPNNWTVQQE